MSIRPEPPRPNELQNTGAPVAGRARFASSELLGGRTEVQIEHRGAIYRLRETRNGKLILYR